jgi:putative FmdB family regulatory protein
MDLEPVVAAESYDAMPIYEYYCKECGVFEVTQRITESSLTSCPTCEGDVHRLISATSFVLKGSGWYATDYARSSAKGESSGDSSSGDSGSKDATANGSSDKSASSPSESSKSSEAESSNPSSDKSASSK